jgi:hypothetical protein
MAMIAFIKPNAICSALTALRIDGSVSLDARAFTSNTSCIVVFTNVSGRTGASQRNLVDWKRMTEKKME